MVFMSLNAWLSQVFINIIMVRIGLNVKFQSIMQLTYLFL